jgi:hypothetical protein
MEKRMRVGLICLAMLTLVAVTGTGPSWAGAWEDAQKLQQSGQQASGSVQGANPSQERARTQAASGWDNRYQAPPPPVALPSHNVGVNPHDLKQYDPKPKKLQKVVPPPPSSQ